MIVTEWEQFRALDLAPGSPAARSGWNCGMCLAEGVIFDPRQSTQILRDFRAPNSVDADEPRLCEHPRVNLCAVIKAIAWIAKALRDCIPMAACR